VIEPHLRSAGTPLNQAWQAGTWSNERGGLAVKTLITVLAASLFAPAAAVAADHPPASDPGKLPPPHPGATGATLHVCKKPRCFQSIQQAVNASRSGDTIKVANGTYREGVVVRNDARKGVRIVGNPRRPEKVVLNGGRLKGAKARNGFSVRGVDAVTIKGFTIRNYRASGVFVRDAVGYLLTRIVVRRTGAYGLYAFNSQGGTMSSSEASEMSGAGFYVGQTPPQVKPRRTFLKGLRAHTNVLGYSGTNARYVTLQRSMFWNNGVGIAPNALDSEKYPPPEFNVIRGNEVFWNNFNHYLGAPFERAPTSLGELAYPVGVGILLFGSRDTVVERNQVYGNYLFGFGMIDQVALEQDDARTVDRNTIRANAFGLAGTDLNGRDIAYDGSGSDNCFADNGDTQNNVPADDSELVACPFSGANGMNEDARGEMIAFLTEPDRERYWVKHPHAPKPGYAPLEHYRADSAPRRRRAGALADTTLGEFGPRGGP
jgi:hypothetical protein